MTDIFLGFLNRSLAAGILILAVVLVRLVFKKAPRWLLCALWALAAVRLVCPVSIESVLSLIPSAEPVQPEIIVSAQPAITSGIPAVDAIVNPPLAAAFTPPRWLRMIFSRTRSASFPAATSVGILRYSESVRASLYCL